MLTGRNEANGGVKSESGSRRSGTEELLTCDGRVRGRNEILREERGEGRGERRREEKRGEEKRREEVKSKVLSSAHSNFPSLEYRYQCSGNLT